MGEVKYRLLHIEMLSKSFVSVGGKMYGDQVFVYEAMCLQLRKILELIAFSTLVANKQSIEPVLTDFGNYWRAKAILKKVATINPHFFPTPARVERDKEIVRIESGPDPETFSLEDFEGLYDACSEVIHSSNPYSEKPVTPIARSFGAWVYRIRKLLKTHIVYLTRDDIQFVDMLDWDDGIVSIVHFETIG